MQVEHYLCVRLCKHFEERQMLENDGKYTREHGVCIATEHATRARQFHRTGNSFGIKAKQTISDVAVCWETRGG